LFLQNERFERLKDTTTKLVCQAKNRSKRVFCLNSLI
jgi:hypothetical protein